MSQEEEYFLREEIEKKRKLALKQSEELVQKQRAELKKLHYMKCPKCGLDLHTLKRGSVEIDTCFNCQGIWLDGGELEQIMAQGSEKSGGVMKAVLNIFGKKE
jgi:ribosomal protein L37AE/L43A